MKELVDVITDAIATINNVFPLFKNPDELSTKRKQDQLLKLAAKHFKKLDYYKISDRVKASVKELLDSKHYIKFHYSTKYPFKTFFIEKLFEEQLPGAVSKLEISDYALTRENDVIVTAEPKHRSK